MEIQKGLCHKCGMCCKAIPFGMDKKELKKKYAKDKTNQESYRLVIEKWTEIPKEEAFRRNPHLAIVFSTMPHFYSCSNLDEKTNLCMIHDKRPSVCSDYPWYGKQPSSDEVLVTEDCGYRIDLERAKLIDVLRKVIAKKQAQGTHSFWFYQKGINQSLIEMFLASIGVIAPIRISRRP